MLAWAEKKITEKKLYKEIGINKYINGADFKIYNDNWIIKIIDQNRKKMRGKLSYPYFIIYRPLNLKEPVLIKKLAQKVFTDYYKSQIIERVDILNEKHFRQKINNVSIKYMNSRWGSCSIKKNISLSSRLLFAPKDVIDYVIIHELAHTFEMNHNSNFWKIVSDKMPCYRQHEKWLKEFGHTCDF